MGNMSYCRFENTARDMCDCIDAINDGEVQELNEYEINAIQEFLQYAKDIVNLEDDIDYCVRKSKKELTN